MYRVAANFSKGAIAAWITVVALFLATGLDVPWKTPWVLATLFAWLFVVVIWSALGAVREAEAVARMIREPFSTLVLTLSVSVTEVVLIVAAMMVDREDSTMARDAMYSVLMIVLNGVVGLGLLIGGRRHFEQTFNLQGASAYLSVVIPLSAITLVLPTFTASTTGGTLTVLQSVCFALMTLLLYGLFLFLQVGRHQRYFVDPDFVDAVPGVSTSSESEAVAQDVPRTPAKPLVLGGIRLLACILPISLLATPLATLLDHGLTALDIPAAVGGIVIAILVFAPEGLSTLIAVTRNELTKAINVSLGATLSTLGITVPVVLFVGLYTGQDVILGLPPTSIVLLATTLILATLTFSRARTTMLEGGVHLAVFVAFLVLAFEP